MNSAQVERINDIVANLTRNNIQEIQGELEGERYVSDVQVLKAGAPDDPEQQSFVECDGKILEEGTPAGLQFKFGSRQLVQLVESCFYPTELRQAHEEASARSRRRNKA